jgi:hypothetical protein
MAKMFTTNQRVRVIFEFKPSTATPTLLKGRMGTVIHVYRYGGYDILFDGDMQHTYIGSSDSNNFELDGEIGIIISTDAVTTSCVCEIQILLANGCGCGSIKRYNAD